MSSFEDVKTKAEACMKEEKYAEAFFHWTKAIHLVENGKIGLATETKLYAQRAKCFLQSEQYYYALEDARKVLEIDPENSLGHLRLAEIYYETEHFMEALPVIGKCFSLTIGRSEKEHLLEWQRKCRKDAAKVHFSNRLHEFKWINPFCIIGAMVQKYYNILGLFSVFVGLTQALNLH